MWVSAIVHAPLMAVERERHERQDSRFYHVAIQVE